MLTREENQLLTETGPGTPCGELMRRYWQPVALSEELPPKGPPIPLKIMSEELVAFRDEEGRVGLLDLHCSHRAADLSYGRLEDGGLRCIYHGWLYDVHGRCLETPNEAPNSSLKNKIRHPAYPCQEAGGVVFAYMGPGEPPLLPAYRVLKAPADRRLATKYFQECNYLQGLEGNLDNTHVKFLHRFFRTEQGVKVLKQRRVTNPEQDANFFRDELITFGPSEIEETDFGIWSNNQFGIRSSDGWQPDFVFPSLCLVGGGPQGHPKEDGYMLYWRVPIDDTHHWLFLMAFQLSALFDPELVHKRTKGLVGADYKFKRNKGNRYLQDREEQRTANFTGMGPDFPVHDACVNEGAGPIQDRTKEHLGQADLLIPAVRKMLLRSIRMVAEGKEPPGVIRDPRVNEVDPVFLKKNRAPEVTA